MAKKLPYLPLYTGDWLKDPKLSLCAPATRGIWMDLICAMHELDRCGELRGTADQLARTARCSTEELVHAVTDLRTTGAAEVQTRNGAFVICNRRMRTDFEKRKSAAERQMRSRASASNASVTQKPPPITDIEIEIAFERFWSVFPKGRKTGKGVAREAFTNAAYKADVEVIIKSAAEYAGSDLGRSKFVKMPQTWLNQECWNDDRAAWKRGVDGELATVAPPEYRQIPMEQFRSHYRSGDFSCKPKSDPKNEKGFCRVWGQLTNGSKVESHTDPDWTPNTQIPSIPIHEHQS